MFRSRFGFCAVDCLSSRSSSLFVSTSSFIRIDFVFYSHQSCQERTSQFWVFNLYLLIVEKVTVENNITQNNKMMTLANKYDKKNRRNLQSFSRTCTMKNEEFRPKRERKWWRYWFQTGLYIEMVDRLMMVRSPSALKRLRKFVVIHCNCVHGQKFSHFIWALLFTPLQLTLVFVLGFRFWFLLLGFVLGFFLCMFLNKGGYQRWRKKFWARMGVTTRTPPTN